MFTFGWMAGGKQFKEKSKCFREAYLKDAEAVRSSAEAHSAIAYCAACIDEYDEWFVWNEAKWLRWQRVVIIGGVVATLAGVLTLPQEWVSFIPHQEALSWIRGVPAAIVTIAAGYLSSFTYREDAVRQEITAQALWNELARYSSRARPYNVNDQADTGEFINKICQIMEAESSGWRALVLNARERDGDRNGQQGEMRGHQNARSAGAQSVLTDVAVAR
jgi:hypothetical protein